MTGMMFFTARWVPDYSMSMAGTLIVMAPIMTVYLFFQRQFIQGLTAGAVRGWAFATEAQNQLKRATHRVAPTIVTV